jgi:hypothetical protein
MGSGANGPLERHVKRAARSHVSISPENNLVT